MKKMMILGLLMTALSCTTVSDHKIPPEFPVETKSQETDLDSKRILSDNETDASFKMTGFFGLQWGATPQELDPIINLEGTKSMWMGDNLLLTDTYTELVDPKTGHYIILNEQLILFTFEKGRLVSVSQLVQDQLQDIDQLCKETLLNFLDIAGPYTSHNSLMLQWQNNDTTIQMSCTGYGPLVNYFSTKWLRRHDGAKPHAAIPLEVIQNARERILGKLKNLEDRQSEPRGDGQSI